MTGKKAVFFHILFWIVYMAIFTFIEGGYLNNFDDAFFIEVAYLPVRLLVAYLNYFFLLDRYLLKGKYTNYILSTLLSIVIAAIIQRFITYYLVYPLLFPDWDKGSYWQAYRLVQPAMIITSPLIFIIGFSIASKWISLERRAELLEKEKLKAELKYLRSQINPHFFFNTLNNLYGLAQEKSDKTAEVVMKLSVLMNYILYEADQDQVKLEKEIEYIKNYIELEEIRYGDRFESSLTVQGDISSTSIAPLLLLPFVENSFKHGVNRESKGAWIYIKLSIKDKQLSFDIENSLLANDHTLESGGLGLDNVVKRLNLLYPNQHELIYGPDENSYKVQLTITL